MVSESVKLFISYSHRDEPLRQQLDKHLAPLKGQKVIEAWHDRQIQAGMNWADQIDNNLKQADIILLLVSPDFVVSNYCFNIELKEAMKRHENGEAIVVPVILEPCDWSWLPFSKLQAFPKDAKAIATWENKNEAFLDVAKGIRKVAQDLFKQRQQKLEEKKAAREQYLKKVEEALSDGKISIAERDSLDDLREELKLTQEEAEEIESRAFEPLKKYQDNLKKYEKTFRKYIQSEYPLSDRSKEDLKLRQRYLGIKTEDVGQIEQPILAEAEAKYQEKLTQEKVKQLELQNQREQQEYENKLRRYEQEFLKAVEREYPLSQYVRNGINSFQESLGLTDEDVAKISQPILAEAETKYQEKLKQEEAEKKRKQKAEAEQQKQLAQDAQKTAPESKKSPSSISLQVFEFNVVTLDGSGREVKRDRSKAEYFTENLGNGVTLDMVAIPGGQFLMGSPEGKGNSEEKPQHSVTVPPFFMGKYQVTQKQWRAVANLPKLERELNPNPSRFKGDNRPVENVSWYDAVEFCSRLSRETGKEYRLPSEAEWEYACRAKTTTPFHFGETITREVVNCKRNLGTAIAGLFWVGETTEVGNFKVANSFGLYDMHGNVWEWCADDWHNNYEGAPTDGSAWLDINKGLNINKQNKSYSDNNDENKPNSVLRGGSWVDNPFDCRSAARDDFGRRENRDDVIGFRVVCVFGRTL